MRRRAQSRQTARHFEPTRHATNAAIRHPAPETTRVRPADRLGFTLFLAAALHLALILGLGVTLSEPKQISKTLEITLSTFKSEEKPKDADFLA
ncbi:hypothetical protein, partial [Escherichia coli]|uniref:hypothetical protein n=1 Tax=Escherichia coli TaxID=562 RepID=UPI0018EF1379